MIQLINDDCVTGLLALPEASVDLVCTSPPYKDGDGYSEDLMHGFLQGCWRVMKPGTLLFLNFGHLAEDKNRPFRVKDIALATGFLLNDTIVWVKNHFSPVQGQRRLNNMTEFIFLLHRGRMPLLDRLSIGVPYKDKSNAKRFNGGQDLRCGGNIWFIDYETVQRAEQKWHNDRFPVELPRRAIKLSGVAPGAVLLDPFAGSGTSAIAAHERQMDFIGFEKCPMQYDNALKRLGANKINVTVEGFR